MSDDSTGARAGTALDAAVDRVVRNANCSGCGACCRLDPGLAMRLDPDGYNRPVRIGPSGAAATAADDFRRICPGHMLVAPSPKGRRTHPTMGPYVSAWRAWAVDGETRHRGSSGGVLTALIGWATENGRATRFVAATSSAPGSSRSEAIVVDSPQSALRAAGSRYAPVSIAAHPAVDEPSASVVGKPCEISAVRHLRDRRRPSPATGSSVEVDQRPLLLSFFCAGTPSAVATAQLLSELDRSESEIEELWYRGRGWPGSFTVTSLGREPAQLSYEDSWGRALGPTIQWRCKICPDGVGADADVTAADLWHSDERGYPVFADDAGVSALIARTVDGHRAVLAAAAAGAITISPLDLDQLAEVQPFQVSRRTSLWGRLLGTRLAGRKIPRYRGYGLLAAALRRPREAIRTSRGSFRRVRAEGQE